MAVAELNVQSRATEADSPAANGCALYARKTTEFPNGEWLFKGDDGVEHSFFEILNHATSHEFNGGDEIDVTDLSGLLGDPQTPLGHGISHKHLGGDEIATATPAANEILKALATGLIADGWIGKTGVTQFIVDASNAIDDFLSASEINDRIDLAVAGLYDHKGAYDAATNTPDLDTAPAPGSIKLGDAYTVSVDGLFFTEQMRAGDVLIADIDDAAVLGDWTRVQRNIDLATTTTPGITETATQTEVNANTDNFRYVTPLTLFNQNFLAKLSGAVFSGQVSFTGTGHSGIEHNNLTTIERDALTAAAGMEIFNTDTDQLEFYDGTSWVTAGGGGTDKERSVTISCQPDAGSPGEDFIGDMPIFILAAGSTKGYICHFNPPVGIDLSTTDPVCMFPMGIFTTGAGTPNIRLRVETRYIAAGELITKTLDETLLLTHGVTNTQDILSITPTFTLDRTAMAITDHFEIHLERLGSDGLDTYLGDMGGMKNMRFDYDKI